MAPMNDLPFTGERFIPGTQGEIWIEHWHRYHFAARWAAGKRVLDVACGEGYGSALLARHAAEVTGVDLSQAAIDHARHAYADLGNARFVCASCTALPLGDASVDLVVSFETLEHIAGQEAFMDEVARVLRPDGVLLLSCPNKREYSDNRGYTNEFHVKELYREELQALVAARFAESDWYAQRPTFYSLIAPETPEGARAQLVEVDEAHPDEGEARLAAPMYFIVAASRRRESLRALPPLLSVLSDRDDWVHRDYEKIYRMFLHRVEEAKALEAQIAERDASIAGLATDAEQLRHAIRLQEAALAAREALSNAQAALHVEALAEKQREIDRRRGWRWWLRLPFIRMGLLD
jgi:ubiquinone/menaquinone biosynthesis C-methylase UbiE